MFRTRLPTPVGAAVALAALIAAAAYLTWVETRDAVPVGAPASSAPAPSAGRASAPASPESTATPAAPSSRAPDRAAPATPAARERGLVMRDQRIRDERGRVIFEGDVDLAPVLARIAAGTRDPHRNDGATFANREGRLPRRPRGYYTEWVVRTPGVGGVGPQRLVTGRDGDAYYTPDHYETFVPVRPPS